MLDYVIRSGTVIDGTGEPGRLADVGIRDGRIVAVGQIDEAGDHRVRRRRARRGPRLRRPAHALRRPALLGPAGLPLQRARRDHRDRRQLRLHPGPHQRRGRRLHPPDDGQGRGHAPGRPGERRAVELVDLRRVPRRARGPASASTPGSWWATAPCGARSWAPSAGEEVATDDEIAAMRALLAESLAGGRAGLLVLPVPHPLRRRRPSHQLALRRPPRDARLLRGGGGARGHHARVHHQRLPGLVQRRGDRPDDRHERHRPAARSTGTC